MEGVMLEPHEIADRLDRLVQKAAALNAAIIGMTCEGLSHDDISAGVADIAWEIRDELRKLSDEVCPDEDAKLKAVAS
jgi:hypothetical protein